MPLQLEVFSDIACPWCYVGKRRLDQALAAFEQADEVEITWRSFELDPSAPAEREGRLVDHLARKYGISTEQALAAQEGIARSGAELGIDFRFAHARSGSTFDGHRLVHLAAEQGRAGEMKERLLRAYFAEGRLISARDTLQDAATDVGIDGAEVDAMLASDRYAAEVRADEQAAAALGVRGVPTFIVDRTIGVTGAQPAELLLEMLRRSAARGQPAR